ncbi:MAG: hypothetical protein KA250_18770 [Verrucomicrobiales bacterium]|nr:hypothetical protein [Verrucomicrobiales bacterium]
MIVAAAAVPVKGGTPVVNVEVADLAEVVAVVEDLAAEPEVGSGVVLDPIVVEEIAIVAVILADVAPAMVVIVVFVIVLVRICLQPVSRR